MNSFIRKWALKIGLVTLGAASVVQTASAGSIAYDTEMVNLIQELHDYKQVKRPSFELMANGGSPLFLPYDGNTTQNVSRLIQSLDGQLAESVFYGYDGKDGEKTPQESCAYFKETLAVPQRAGIPVFSLDYVSNCGQAEESYRLNRQYGYISWASTHRNLDYLPEDAPPAVNSSDCNTLKDVQNFLVLLNPGHFSSKQAYLQSLQDSPYDLLIIDLYCEDKPLTAAEVAALRTKPQGGRRLVLAYMSVGEAEEYRSYWQADWKQKKPSWIAGTNEDWGSHRVRYWQPQWKHILFGSPDAYLDTILAAGFDGAFLDVVDVYQYFRDKKN